MTTAEKALALLGIYAESPALIDSATREALQAFCSALDPNGDFEPCTRDDLRAIALEWAADYYHATNRG